LGATKIRPADQNYQKLFAHPGKIPPFSYRVSPPGGVLLLLTARARFDYPARLREPARLRAGHRTNGSI
jgi:hypothetical protein